MGPIADEPDHLEENGRTDRGVDGDKTPADDLTPAFGLGEGDDAWLRHVRRARRPVEVIGAIGRYELVEELGHGGQGTVYKAIQPGTGRLVAIKRLASAVSVDDPRVGALREVEALTRLEHPNVVTVHGVEAIGGRAVLVMQLVEGSTIDRWADSILSDAARPDDVSRILETFVRVCDGVAHAHQRGVIHRDIKPSNVLVDLGGAPHVLDFGIARLLDETMGPAAARDPTTAGFAGTPTYAAPERLAGRTADTRGDVYSLGVLLYRMLVGADPFSQFEGLNQLVTAVSAGSVRRPSEVRASLPRDLDWIVLKAMAVDCDQRYQSVGELAADVRRFLAGEAIVAHPPTVKYRLRTFVRRHWAALVVAGLVAGALVTATVVSWRSASRVSVALADTEKALQAAAVERDTQRELATVFREVLRGGDTGNTFGRPDMTIREALDIASTRLLGGWRSPTLRSPHGPVVEAVVRMAIAETYTSMGLVAPAEQHLRAALQARIAAFGPTSRETIEPRHQLARLHRMMGRLDEAIALQREVVALRREHAAEQPLHLAQALTTLGITLRHAGAFDEAELALREALGIYSEGMSPDDENVGQVLASLSVVLMQTGRLAEAEDAARRAVLIGRAHHADHPHHDLAAALENLGAVLCAPENRSRATAAEGELLMREGLAMHRAVSGEKHIQSGRAATHLADVLAAQCRWDEAIPLYRSALDTYKSLHPPGSPSITEAADKLGAALVATGRGDEAAALRSPASPASPDGH